MGRKKPKRLVPVHLKLRCPARGRTSNWRALLVRNVKARSWFMPPEYHEFITKCLASRSMVRFTVERCFLNWTKTRYTFGIRGSSNVKKTRSWLVKSKNTGPSSTSVEGRKMQMNFVPDPSKYAAGKVEIGDVSSISGKFDDCCVVLEKSASSSDSSSSDIVIVDNEVTVMDTRRYEMAPQHQEKVTHEHVKVPEERKKAPEEQKIREEQKKIPEEKKMSAEQEKVVHEQAKVLEENVSQEKVVHEQAKVLEENVSQEMKRAFRGKKKLSEERTVFEGKMKVLEEKRKIVVAKQKIPEVEEIVLEENEETIYGEKVPGDNKKFREENKLLEAENKKISEEQKKNSHEQETALEDKNGAQEMEKARRGKKRLYKENNALEVKIKALEGKMEEEGKVFEGKEVPEVKKVVFREEQKISDEGKEIFEEKEESREEKKLLEGEKEVTEEQKLVPQRQEKISQEKTAETRNRQKEEEEREVAEKQLKHLAKAFWLDTAKTGKVIEERKVENRDTQQVADDDLREAESRIVEEKNARGIAEEVAGSEKNVEEGKKIARGEKNCEEGRKIVLEEETKNKSAEGQKGGKVAASGNKDDNIAGNEKYRDVHPLIVRIMKKCTDRVEKTTGKLPFQEIKPIGSSCCEESCCEDGSKKKPEEQLNDTIGDSFSTFSSCGLELMRVGSFQENNLSDLSSLSDLTIESGSPTRRGMPFSPTISSCTKQPEEIVSSESDSVVVTSDEEENAKEAEGDVQMSVTRYDFRFASPLTVVPDQEKLPDKISNAAKIFHNEENAHRETTGPHPSVADPVNKNRWSFLSTSSRTAFPFVSTPMVGFPRGTPSAVSPLRKGVLPDNPKESRPVRDAATNTSRIGRSTVCHCRKFNLRARRLHRKLLGLKKLLLYRTSCYQADRNNLISLLKDQSKIVENNSKILENNSAVMRLIEGYLKAPLPAKESKPPEDPKKPETILEEGPVARKRLFKECSDAKDLKRRAKSRLSLSQRSGTEMKSKIAHIEGNISLQKAAEFSEKGLSSSTLDSSVEMKYSQESVGTSVTGSVVLEEDRETNGVLEEELKIDDLLHEDEKTDEQTVEELKKCLQDVEVDECLRDLEADEKAAPKKRKHIRFQIDEEDKVPDEEDEVPAEASVPSENDCPALRRSQRLQKNFEIEPQHNCKKTRKRTKSALRCGSPSSDEDSAWDNYTKDLVSRLAKEFSSSSQNSERTEFDKMSEQPEPETASWNEALKNEDILSHLFLDEQVAFHSRKIDPNFDGFSYDETAMRAILSDLKANKDLAAAEEAILHGILGRSNGDSIRAQLRQYLKIFLPNVPFYFDVYLDLATGLERLRVVSSKARSCGERIGLEGFKVPAGNSAGKLILFASDKSEKITELVGPASFAAHSCTPNAKIVSVDRNFVEVVALSEMVLGEEICIAEGFGVCCNQPIFTSPEKKSKRKFKLFGSHLKSVDLHDSVFKF